MTNGENGESLTWAHVGDLHITGDHDRRAPDRVANGSDADAVGAWPERHVLGTQLGPNRNGRHW
jgi:hypothetical protein